MNKLFESDYDCMIIGAHPDDAELGCGGTIAKLVKENKKVVIVDMTRGEMGTRGNAEIRDQEAKSAAKILGVEHRENLGLRDGFVRTTEESLYKIVSVIRKYRPKSIIMHPPFERHPDHENTHKLVRDSLFKIGLTKFETLDNGKPQEVFRTRKIYCYMQAYQFPRQAAFFVDISDVYEKKLEAIHAFSSQVYTPGQYENESFTSLATPEFMQELIARDRYYGGMTGVKYAEGFLAIEPILVNSVATLL